MSRCAICGTDNSKDLYVCVTSEKVCSICKVKFVGGLPTTDKRIENVRASLGLQPGEFLSQDRGEEARKILGR